MSAAASNAIAYSPYDSARFGLRVFRGSPPNADADALLAELERERVDVAILRGPFTLALADALAKDGLRTIVAGTLVHYAADLLKRPASGPFNDVELRRVPAEDVERLANMVREIFNGYATHYHTNPLFAPAHILDGYAEWAVRHAQANAEGRSAWFIERNDEIVGFSCTRHVRERGEMRGVLNGILPAHRGHGIYRGMLRSLLDRCIDEAIPRFAISTQAQNLAVQHVWRTEAMQLERSEPTIHVNALLGRAAARSVAATG